MNFEDIMLSEKSRAWKDKSTSYHLHVECKKKAKSIEKEKWKNTGCGGFCLSFQLWEA
jgi:hypothetical protein